MRTQTTDVVVVGSGAGGGAVAYRLAKSGVKVVVIEKGRPRPLEDAPEDELAELQLERHRPFAEDDPTLVYSEGKQVARASRVGQAFYLSGGGTVRYTATSWRLRPDDFRKKSRYGAIPGADLADWPLSYDELEPYYTEAELEIGVSGEPGVDPTEPMRARNVLLPPLKEDNYQRVLSKAARSLGWRPFVIPVAIHSRPSDRTGASQCMQCGWCSGFPCQFRAKSSVDLVLFPRAERTGNFTLVSNAYVTRILTGPGGKRAKGVEYIDLETGETGSIGAKVVVLAASAIQSARLLLLSGTGGTSALANSSGLVGRNLMFHIEAKGSAVFDEDFHPAFYKKVGIHDFYYPGRGDSFVNHRSIQSGSKAPPVSFALSKKGFGAGFIRSVQEAFLRTQELQCMVEDLPQPGNQVVLSGTAKDPWGQPAPEVHHRYHEQDRKAAIASLDKIRTLFEAAGAKQIEVPADIHSDITGRYTWHLMGTTRMGKDAMSSVVNRDCQSHDIPNLFIADGGVFPTSAGLNPTLTIQALAFRTADRIVALSKEGKV